jgi:hypothetical protein
MKIRKFYENIDYNEEWEEEPDTPEMKDKIQELSNLINDSELIYFIINKAVSQLKQEIPKLNLNPHNCIIDFIEFYYKDGRLNVTIVDEWGNDFGVNIKI